MPSDPGCGSSAVDQARGSEEGGLPGPRLQEGAAAGLSGHSAPSDPRGRVGPSAATLCFRGCLQGEDTQAGLECLRPSPPSPARTIQGAQGWEKRDQTPSIHLHPRPDLSQSLAEHRGKNKNYF